MNSAIGFDDVNELDRQYDIALAIPEITVEVQKLMVESEKIRAEHQGYRSFNYGDKPLQNLDYFPANKNSPLLVYIHGGYWHKLDKAVFSVVGKAWTDVGISVAVVNYRLAPIVGMGDIVGDVRKSIIWLWSNSSTLEFDRDNIVVCGSSAGGHLTAMMLATDWPEQNERLPKNLLKGGVSISGLHDISPFIRAPFLKNILRLTESEVRAYSPALLAPATLAPIITCVGGDESPAFHAQNNLIAEKWGRVFRENIISPNTNHVTVNGELTNRNSNLFMAAFKLFD